MGCWRAPDHQPEIDFCWAKICCHRQRSPGHKVGSWGKILPYYSRWPFTLIMDQVPLQWMANAKNLSKKMELRGGYCGSRPAVCFLNPAIATCWNAVVVLNEQHLLKMTACQWEFNMAEGRSAYIVYTMTRRGLILTIKENWGAYKMGALVMWVGCMGMHSLQLYIVNDTETQTAPYRHHTTTDLRWPHNCEAVRFHLKPPAALSISSRPTRALDLWSQPHSPAFSRDFTPHQQVFPTFSLTVRFFFFSSKLF